MAGPRIPPKVLSGKGGGEALLHKHLELYFTPSLLEAQTVCAVFQDNAQLYGELGHKAIARAKGQFIRNCQNMVMQELKTTARTSSTTTIRRSRRFTFRNKRAIYSAEFFFDMARCASANHDRKHVDFALEHCMTTSVVTTFSRSPFSDQRRLGPDLPACLSLSSCSRWMRYFNTKPSPGSRKTIGGGPVVPAF